MLSDPAPARATALHRERAARDRPGRIVVSDLTKTFGGVRAVDALSFTVDPGSVTGFLGPNGAGKTTTLRILLGLVTPDSGSATISGHTYPALHEPAGEVGAALEATGFHPSRSGRDHLRVFCTVMGLPQSRADAVLAQVGLAEAGRRTVGGYSLGMRQRLALATALLGDPTVLVLDEPANGLDPAGIAWMRRLLRDLAGQGRTVLVSSHVLSEIQQLVDHVVILHRGRLVHQGLLTEMPGVQAGTRVSTPDPDDLVAALGTAAGNGIRIERTGPGTLTVTGMTAPEIGHRAWRAHIEVHELTPQRSDLEHVFFALTSGDRAKRARPYDN
ncbi:ABC transporter ATP-binding protein [soil metagenome]